MNWNWWLRQGLFVWLLLTLLWGAATIVWDVVVLWASGVQDTISWQTQVVSRDNPVIPAAVGFLVWGLAVHFWKVRAWGWTDERQPLLYWLLGGILGAVFVALTWTQRGGSGP